MGLLFPKGLSICSGLAQLTGLPRKGRDNLALSLYEMGYQRLPGYFGSNFLMIYLLVSKFSVANLGIIVRDREINILQLLISIQLLSAMFTATVLA